MGRPISATDVDLKGVSAKVAVLGYGCWKNRFHCDKDVVGKVVRINGTPLTVIGVAPEEFGGLQIDIAAEAFVPIGYSGDRAFQNPDHTWFSVFGRLSPGFTMEKARAQLQTVWPGVRLAALPPSFQNARRANFFPAALTLLRQLPGTLFSDDE